MIIKVAENREIVLKEVFNPIHLFNGTDEHISICMRDDGFEINLNGTKWRAQGNVIIEV